MNSSLLVALTALLIALPAHAARVDLAGVSASSTYPSEEGMNYDARLVHDGKSATSWVEGEEGSGLGSWVEVDLGGERVVTRVEVWHGLWHSYNFFKRANRPSDLELRFSDGSTQAMALKDEMAAQVLEIPGGKRTSTIRFKVKGVHSGSTWLDTGISEIQIFDDQAGSQAEAAGFAASSVAPADGDGSYEAAKVADGLRDTMWCEGGSGDGAGEWLELRFAGATTVGTLTLVNGMGSSMPFWMKGNRATAATLQFSDGSTEQVELRNVFLQQSVDFAPRTTSSVRVTFDGVVKGKEFDDLCISEAYFSE